MEKDLCFKFDLNAISILIVFGSIALIPGPSPPGGEESLESLWERRRAEVNWNCTMYELTTLRGFETWRQIEEGAIQIPVFI